MHFFEIPLFCLSGESLSKNERINTVYALSTAIHVTAETQPCFSWKYDHCNNPMKNSFKLYQPVKPTEGLKMIKLPEPLYFARTE